MHIVYIECPGWWLWKAQLGVVVRHLFPTASTTFERIATGAQWSACWAWRGGLRLATHLSRAAADDAAQLVPLRSIRRQW